MHVHKKPIHLETKSGGREGILSTVLLLFSEVFSAVIRLYKQTARVMDMSLLNTTNLHEVKHWIEPGQLYN
jgi:hypothetical protein